MIIWRGWGILALLIGAGSAGIGTALGRTAELRPVYAGLCLILGGIGTWALGQWLNQNRPVPAFAAWQERRKQELGALAHAGQFNQVADPSRPGQLLDPLRVADGLLQRESAAVRSGMFNRHTLFFIPIQFLGLAMAAGGMILAAVSFLT